MCVILLFVCALVSDAYGVRTDACTAMSAEPIVLWVNEQEGDTPEIFAIPVSMFGDTLPPLDDFVTAVTMPPRDDGEDESSEEDEDDDATEHPSGDEGDEQKGDRKAAPKRQKVDPAKRAFRNNIDASEYMSALLRENGIPACRKVWERVWSNPVKVIVSVSFDV